MRALAVGCASAASNEEEEEGAPVDIEGAVGTEDADCTVGTEKDDEDEADFAAAADEAAVESSLRSELPLVL